MGNFYEEVIRKDPRFMATAAIRDVNLLEPVTRAAVAAILADSLAAGLELMVFETYRSQERQSLLFDRGATQLRTVGVHHYGLACDIVKVVKGQSSWDGDFSFLGRLGKKHGLIWGGDWGTPKRSHSFRDYDHVQRCTVADQEGLFSGGWYPAQDYDPYASLFGSPLQAQAVYRLGSKGEAVFKIQCRLKNLGYFPTGRTDWIYGPETAEAVAAFQRGHGGLVVDGECGPATLAALEITL
jgi:hypothetical protein